MKTINFSYSLKLDRDTYKKYLKAGLHFDGFQEGYGFKQVHVNVDNDTLAQNLSQMGYEGAYNLVPHLHDSDIGPAIEKAQGLWQLNRMGQETDSGYPFGFFEHEPATWELQGQIATEINALNERLQQHGIDQVRIGQELEFSLPEKPVDGFTHWQDVKSSIIRQLEFEIAAASGEERERLSEKLTEVNEFNAREVFMYDMIELDDRTKDILEPLFGRTRDGDGYYDGQNCLELKIDHSEISEYSQRHQAVLNVMIEKAKQYGLPINSPPTSHLNFSFWDEQGNIMHPDHPEYTSKGKVIAEGITRTAYDALPVILDTHLMGIEVDEDVTLALTTDREGFLRSATGRIEVRPSISGIDQHTDLMIVPVMAGTLSALEHQNDPDYADEYHQAQIVGSGSYKKPKDEMKVFAHVMSNSDIDADGNVTVPENYVVSKANDLAYNLGLIDEEPQPGPFDMFMGKADYADGILEFIQGIRVDQSGDEPQLIFSTNDAQGYRFVTPEINLDKIPPAAAEKIRNGVKPEDIRDEWMDYIPAGDRIPKASEKYVIDTAALAEKFSITKVEDRLVITDGYDLNASQYFGDSRDQEPRLYTKVERMKDSAVLKGTLSTAFHAALNLAIDKATPKPVTYETVPEDRKENIKALLQAARETQLTTSGGQQSVVSQRLT